MAVEFYPRISLTDGVEFWIPYPCSLYCDSMASTPVDLVDPSMIEYKILMELNYAHATQITADIGQKIFTPHTIAAPFFEYYYLFEDEALTVPIEPSDPRLSHM